MAKPHEMHFFFLYIYRNRIETNLNYECWNELSDIDRIINELSKEHGLLFLNEKALTKKDTRKQIIK